MSNIQTIVMISAALAGGLVQFRTVRHTMRRVKKKYKRRFIYSWRGSWFVLMMGLLASAPGAAVILFAYMWAGFPTVPGWLLGAIGVMFGITLLITCRIPYRRRGAPPPVGQPV